ncbi:hypothetical protein PWT90_04534 [Aphanocladium album]|nr:hypothetical protein PWT90_04534 [Aphanocladium album]
MVPAPPPLPTQFPCWCRAVYSWGGEGKRDLGFIEGDLIECLNAGDGSWWVGRLYRDRRTVGSFPSNFVKVLPEEFRPSANRSVSPVPPSIAPSPSRSKPFRRPFEAYAKAPHYTSAKTPITFREEPAAKPTTPVKPPASSPAVARAKSGATSMMPEHTPSPPRIRAYDPRAASPAPSFRRPGPPAANNYSHQQSPPPPPPPHKHVGRAGSVDIEPTHAMSRHGSVASYHPQPPHMPRHASQLSYREPDDFHRHASGASYDEHGYDGHSDHYSTPRRAGSYMEHSPGGSNGMTPSPLREAMDGVMEQLDELEGLGSRTGESPGPEIDPWAPESFGLESRAPRAYEPDLGRPRTSMGIAQSDEGYETWSGESSQVDGYKRSRPEQTQELPQLSNYVERMEKRFQKMHQHNNGMPVCQADGAPAPPPKNQPYTRPSSSAGDRMVPDRALKSQKSAYDIRDKGVIGRSYTTKTNATNSSSGNQSNTSYATQSSGRTLWSGASASGFSSTSAGSLARNHHHRAQSAVVMREVAEIDRPDSPFTGVSYHSSHATNASGAARPMSQAVYEDPAAGLGGLVQPKAPKRNIFKKIFESAKTGVANNRGSVAGGSGTEPGNPSPFNRSYGSGVTASARMGGMRLNLDASREMGAGPIDWVQVRRDINRSNSLSNIERAERRDRCQIQDHPALNPVDELHESIEGDEAADGNPVLNPLNYQSINLTQVDKNSRFINEASPMTTAISLATTYVCRPYRSDVQRLRAIFTWVSEKIAWEEDFEGEINTREVIQSKRGCAEEYAVLVMEMCLAVGIKCEVVRGYLKVPGEVADGSMMPRPNHWWNAVLVDNEWRMMDCCLASPSNPKRSLYSSLSSTAAEPWWFLTRPSELCWTHVPEHHEQQHIVPPVADEILLNLPCVCPTFFKDGVEMVDYNTSSIRIEDLEMVHLKMNVPADIEIVAEVETRAYSQDYDGDVFESGEVVKTKALAQAEWYGGVKRYTVKALLPGDEGQGVLKIYAGTRGLMHSIKDVPHPLALALPIIHTGENPPYQFVTRHPTPHAQRNDIYIVQPQCQRLALNNTFVFAIRQHPCLSAGGAQSSLTPSSNPGRTSPNPFARPSSAMSMTASSVNGSNPSSASGTVAGQKPAKLAIQTPGGKILRLMRKEDRKGITVTGRDDDEMSDGGTWETIIKCSETGIWRGLVLADRTARWCVFAEWHCVG